MNGRSARKRATQDGRIGSTGRIGSSGAGIGEIGGAGVSRYALIQELAIRN